MNCVNADIEKVAIIISIVAVSAAGVENDSEKCVGSTDSYWAYELFKLPMNSINLSWTMTDYQLYLKKIRTYENTISVVCKV